MTAADKAPRFEPSVDGGLRGIAATVYVDRAQSTQDIARALAETGAPQGTLVIAGEQSGGRGRLGRNWHSAPGGLYMSLILRPKAAPADLSALGIAAAESAAKTLKSLYGLKTRVKPPNDVLALDPAKRAYRKISGILAEAPCAGASAEWIALGMGVNLSNALARELDSATTVKRITGKTPARDEFLKAFFSDFWNKYSAWELQAASRRR
ncbi:MAG: biotin--[acetyl-CoA-carboxylase] ligase [Elusimicrobiales bacterium]